MRRLFSLSRSATSSGGAPDEGRVSVLEERLRARLGDGHSCMPGGTNDSAYCGCSGARVRTPPRRRSRRTSTVPLSDSGGSGSSRARVPRRIATGASGCPCPSWFCAQKVTDSSMLTGRTRIWKRSFVPTLKHRRVGLPWPSDRAACSRSPRCSASVVLGLCASSRRIAGSARGNPD